MRGLGAVRLRPRDAFGRASPSPRSSPRAAVEKLDLELQRGPMGTVPHPVASATSWDPRPCLPLKDEGSETGSDTASEAPPSPRPRPPPTAPQSPQRLVRSLARMRGRAPSVARSVERAVEGAAAALRSWSFPDPPPVPKARPRIPADVAARRGVVVGAMGIAALARVTGELGDVDDRAAEVEAARERLAEVAVRGPDWRGKKLKLATPLPWACTHVRPGEDPINGRIVTCALMPRAMDVGSAVEHCEGVVSDVRSAGLVPTHAYVGKSSVWRWPRTRVGDRSPPRSRARRAEFALRDLETWAPDAFTGRLADHLDHGDLLIVVYAVARGVPNLGGGGRAPHPYNIG